MPTCCHIPATLIHAFVPILLHFQVKTEISSFILPAKFEQLCCTVKPANFFFPLNNLEGPKMNG